MVICDNESEVLQNVNKPRIKLNQTHAINKFWENGLLQMTAYNFNPIQINFN